jgi:hypothetical protein
MAVDSRISALELQLQNLSLDSRFKDLSLAARIREWFGSDKGKTLTEFLAQVEQCAKVSCWSSEDQVNIIKAKLGGEAPQFVTGRDELNNSQVTLERLKEALTERFSDRLPARYYYNLLHDAKQHKGESPSQFLDRCRALSLKTIRISRDAAEQRILKEEAESRLLTRFVHGLRSYAGRELRFRVPNTVYEALNIAMIIHNTEELERQEKNREIFWAKTESEICYRCNQTGHRFKQCRARLQYQQRFGGNGRRAMARYAERTRKRLTVSRNDI